MDNSILKNTILNNYPLYTKKIILKQAVNEGLVINNRKNEDCSTLNFTNCIDVSNDETIEDKIKHTLDSENILAIIEEYDYKKPYRHFCYFKYSSLNEEKIKELVKNGAVNVFDKKIQRPIDDYKKPTIYLLGEQIYFKFSYKLKDNNSNTIKYVILAIIDKENKILEMRFDRVGIAYKNSYSYYKDKILEIRNFLDEKIGLSTEDIDFKAVVDFMKSECDDMTILAQRMTRNGTTAYLESCEDENDIIPILGELDSFIEEQKELFDIDDNTKKIREKLQEFKEGIEIKSDIPLVKIRIDKSGIKFGIIHNYKGEKYSLFMIYGELIGEEMMGSVKEYVMQCDRDFRAATSADVISTEEV